MSSAHNLEVNKALIRRWFEEVWNQGRAEAIPDIGEVAGTNLDSGVELDALAKKPPPRES